jgi:phosphoesterase RecJ-like protein
MHSTNLPCGEVKKMIEEANAISILSHINPDADTLGTALGIYALLKTDKSKKVEVVNASTELPQKLDFLPNFKKIKHKIDYTDSLIITCDCATVERVGLDLTGRTIINIDHHQSNTMYGDVNVVEGNYASASQVAYACFKPLYNINEDAATCFYTSLLSDTLYFTTSSVNVKVFHVAKELLELGANPANIAQNFTQRNSLASLRILEKALSSLRLYEDAKVATIVITKDDLSSTGASLADMEGVVDYAKSLVTVEVAVFAMELDDGVRISLRSKGVDISKVAAVFGGGGHKVSSGFMLKQCGLQESIDRILEKIKELGLINET